MKRLALTSFALCLLITCQSAPGANTKDAVKVFILAGQSNMEGKAAASTLKAVIDDNPNDPQLKHLIQLTFPYYSLELVTAIFFCLLFFKVRKRNV